MNEAWKSTFTLARETAPLGAPTGARIKIPGIRTIYLTPDVKRRFTTKNIFRRTNFNAALHQSWSLSISREFAPDAFADLWLDSVADGTGTTAGGITTRTHRRERSPLTFTADLTTPGEPNARRLRGISLASIELVVQSNRMIIEESTWVVLRNDDLPLADYIDGTQLHRPATTALQATGSLAIGLGAWTPEASPTAIFSGQIMLSRDIEAVQFNEEGQAQKLSTAGAFELLGTAILSPQFGNLAALTGLASPCRLFWSLGTATQQVQFEIQNGIAKASGSNILHSGDGTVPLDWMANADTSGAFVTRRVDL